MYKILAALFFIEFGIVVVFPVLACIWMAIHAHDEIRKDSENEK